MTIDRQALLNWKFEDIEQTYTMRDTMLYALGVGAGFDPLDMQELNFVYEESLRALPSMAVVLGYPGFWMQNPKLGADWKRVLHGEQGLVLHKPLPPQGTVIGRTRVTDVFDKGVEKGAVVISRREVIEKFTGELLCEVSMTSMLRGDGGCGGPSGPLQPARQPVIPDRVPDAVCALPTVAQAALIYRLSGDFNPLHVDPRVAQSSGYPRPILHGLCTYAVACRAILKSFCDYRPERLKSMHCRFTAPVYPGETIEARMWQDGAYINFTARVLERDVQVLGNGVAELGAG